LEHLNFVRNLTSSIARSIFGSSVAVDEAGTVVVGARRADRCGKWDNPARRAFLGPGGCRDAGAAYVFEYDATGGRFTFSAFLKAGNAQNDE
jgi:hypothetical protein